MGLWLFLGAHVYVRNVCSHIKASTPTTAPLRCFYCVNRTIFAGLGFQAFRGILGLRLRALGDDIP